MSLPNSVNNTYIIIVTYNGMQWLQSCLESCGQYPVIVVDNASTDGTLAFVAKNFPQVQVFPQTKNLGFGQANNLGIRHALKQGAEHVFLLNQDAYLIDNCIDQLVDFQKRKPEYGVLSPVHYNGVGTELDEKFVLYLNRYKVNERLFYDAFNSHLSEVYSIEFVNAAGWLVSKECLYTVGGFDPLFFHYGEDRNYCQRLSYHNFQLGVVPSAKLSHDRENRKARTIEKYSNAYYEEHERYVKVDWGDINLQNFSERYDARYRYLLSKCYLFLLKFQFKKAKDLVKKRITLKRLKTELVASRVQNKKVAKSYL